MFFGGHVWQFWLRTPCKVPVLWGPVLTWEVSIVSFARNEIATYEICLPDCLNLFEAYLWTLSSLFETLWPYLWTVSFYLSVCGLTCEQFPFYLSLCDLACEQFPVLYLRLCLSCVSYKPPESFGVSRLICLWPCSFGLEEKWSQWPKA